jgi:chaperonin GroES
MNQTPNLKFKPLGNKILVEPNPVADKIGRIFLPENAKEKSLEGTVITLGTGKRNKSGQRITFWNDVGENKPARVSFFEVKPGDKIIYGKFAGTELEIGGRKFNLIHADDVLAILE